MTTPQQALTPNHATGVVMIIAAVLSVFVMAHHPTGATHAGLAEGVHGAMMTFTLLLVAGFIQFSLRRGVDRFVISAAMVAYCAGAIGNLLAALISGFVMTALVARDVGVDVKAFAWALNQAAAYGAVYAFSVAFALWGGDLTFRGRGFDRVVGIVGLIAGAVPVFALASGALKMNVSGAFIVYALQAAFSVSIGVWLFRGRG